MIPVYLDQSYTTGRMLRQRYKLFWLFRFVNDLRHSFTQNRRKYAIFVHDSPCVSRPLGFFSGGSGFIFLLINQFWGESS